MSVEAVTEAILALNQAKTVEAVQKALDEGEPIQVILNRGLIAAMDELGRRFTEGSVFVPEMLLASFCMKGGLELLRPRLVSAATKMAGTVVMGAVAGDQHDIGKNLVSMMLEGSGFKVVDIGVNQPKENFLKAAREHEADIVGLSALLTTCIPAMEAAVACLKQNLPAVKVMVGGAAVTVDTARRIQADGYCADAPAAVEMARAFTGG